MEHIIENTIPFNETLNAHSLLGKKVLSRYGFVVGKVSQIRMNPKSNSIDGVVVKRGLFRDPLYIDTTYFARMTSQSIMLKIEPSILLKKKKVITSDGESVGKVIQVNRVKQSNTLKSVIVKGMFRAPMEIMASDIKSFGKALILKSGYHVPRRTLFGRGD